jgi:hypothetical protein
LCIDEAEKYLICVQTSESIHQQNRFGAESILLGNRFCPDSTQQFAVFSPFFAASVLHILDSFDGESSSP